MSGAAPPAAPGSLWRDGRFVRFWSGQTVSQFGDRITELALPLIAVTTLHASANKVAWLTALVWTPNLAALVLGAWVDQRTRKRRLMVVADLARALVLLSLPVTYLAGVVTLGQLYAVAFLTGTAAVVFNTAYSAFFAHLVPRASYVDANSKLSTSRSASYAAGPAIGGALVQALSAPVAVLADAASFLVSAFLVGRIRTEEPPPAEAHPSLLRRAREGMTFVVRHPLLRVTLGCAATLNFFTFIASTGLTVLFATRVLHLTAGEIGLALGVGATGGLLGGVIAPRMSRRWGVGPSIAVGAVLYPAPIAVAALAGGPLWVRGGALALAEFLSGIGVMFFDVNLNSLQTSVIHDGIRSRVSGAYSTVNYGVRPIGAAVGGVLATSMGLRATLLLAAGGGALSVLWLVFSPVLRIRTLDQAPAAAPAQDQAGRADTEVAAKKP
ncbi:Predicted arabinose efflux permease, MFS family [Streptomyces sp. DvalAA-14]|uniref:MFS transporter n=1 Tax=unclassified Streptomyces TaxID=2593676 RepID=UPI00081AEC33|nr:MFS transporter [Streptomyces sp. DvalAA-14]MYS21220.1 MFS transporter [Streptomyces sp. SID4948]SCD87134.1 Predicted arabinose efflux permease, MFS family [Streptomyces sp. DvalAA-14]